MLSIKLKDIKVLWGRSGNRCAMCKRELTHDSNTTSSAYLIGEQAHIVGEKNDSPRGESSLSLEERNSYHNLILLCPNDHTEIDKNEKDYPLELLYILKSKHELWVSSALSEMHEEYISSDTDGLNLLFKFIPFLSLQMCLESFPYQIKTKFLDVGFMFHIFSKSNPHLYPFTDNALQERFEKYIYYQLQIEDLIGPFSSRYGKNIYDGNINNLVFLNTNFSEKEEKEILEEANIMQHEFKIAYNDLIQFIKNNLSDVRFNTYTED